MCEQLELLKEDGRIEGKIESKVEDIKRIANKLNKRFIEAMDFLEIPMHERKEIELLLVS